MLVVMHSSPEGVVTPVLLQHPQHVPQLLHLQCFSWSHTASHYRLQAFTAELNQA
jgi:hypothetical protein